MSDLPAAPVPPPLSAALAAAHAGDLAALHAVLNWQLSEAPILARSAGRGVPGLLVSGLDHGIAEVRGRHREPGLAADLLRPVAQRLAGATGARPATPAESGPVLRAARVEPLPAEVSDEQRAWFDGLRRQAAQLRDVWLVETVDGPLPVILVPDGATVVLPFDAQAYD